MARHANFFSCFNSLKSLINSHFLFVSRRHGDLCVFLRSHRDSSVCQRAAISVHGAPADVRPLEARRRQIHHRTVSDAILFVYGCRGRLLCCACSIIKKSKRKMTIISIRYRAALGRVCVKLVIVMGVTWICDVLSWAVGGPQHFWYVSDIINSLQGLFIFIVVGCQPQVRNSPKSTLPVAGLSLYSSHSFLHQQVWSALKRLWTSRSGDHRMTGTTNGPQHSISSHGIPSMDASVMNNTTTTTKVVPVETMC